MTARRLGAALILSAAIAGTAAAQEGEGLQGDTLTFELKNNIIFVDATINGQGPFTFIFDTGASVTIVTPKTAKKLGLVQEQPGEEGLGGLLKNLLGGQGFIEVDSIGMGKALVPNMPVAVMAVPQADIPLRLLGIHYDGILGYNYISQFELTLNYKTQTIRLEPSGYVPRTPEDMLADSPDLAEMLKRLFTEPQPDRPFKPAPPAASEAEGAPAEPKTPKPAAGTPYIGFWPDDTERGVTVGRVLKESPAEAAGLKEGDLLLSVDGRAVDSTARLLEIAADFKPGDDVAVVVERDGREWRMSLKVGSTEGEK